MKDKLPNSVTPTIRDICRDALAIGPMYARLHALGAEPERGESLHTTGSPRLRPDGSETGYVPEMAVESAHAESRRDYARRIVEDLEAAAKVIRRLQQSLERNVGPTPGYRQPTTIGSDAIVSITELTFSLERQEQRLRSGVE